MRTYATLLLLFRLPTYHSNTCPSRNSEESECLLYLANSTIKNGGVGIFTSRELLLGEEVGYEDVMIPWIDFFHHHPIEFTSNHHPFYSYLWQGFGALNLESADRGFETVQILGSGLEAAINCHLALVNTLSTTGSIVHDDQQMNRSLDPGAGAFSPYQSGKTKVAHPIPPGGELFKMYTDDWFRKRSKEFGLVPLSEDYVQADILIQKFGKFFPKAHELTTLNNLHKDLWDIMAYFPFPSRVTNAIPKRHDHIPLAIRQDIWQSYVIDSIRPMEELTRTGRCLDNISPCPSTLVQAGRGAFATRSFSAGEVITGSPVLHVENGELFAMYEDVFDSLIRATREGNSSFPDNQRTSIRTYQISLNYCFKHSDSTLLLCPYGANVGYINHNKTKTNVKVQWAPNGEIGHDRHSLRENFSQLVQSYKPRLAFDYVATRDILMGDELYLDYGVEWETAWQEHSSQYPQSSTSEAYLSAGRWNTLHADSDLRTNEELELDPYPPNLELRCHPDVANRAVNVVLPRFQRFTWTLKEAGLPCTVLRRWRQDFGSSKMTLYAIGMEHECDPVVSEWECICSEVTGAPRGAIRFFDLPYTTDLYLPGAFRHPIGLPDEMFPFHWKHP